MPRRSLGVPTELAPLSPPEKHQPQKPPAGLDDSAFGTPDLAPTAPAERKWGLRDVAALWVSMAACVPTYMLASSLIEEGMSWSQAVLTILLGNLIVLLP